ncbi:MAG: ABC transporter permease [Monoglobaceae bacterium]
MFFKKNFEYLIMVLPGFVQIILFNYLPLFGLVIAFKSIDYRKGIFGSPWVGLKNFEFLFKNPDVFVVVRNTLLYNLAFIVLGLVIPVLFAILLSQIRNKFLPKLYQSIMFLPHFLSWVIVSYVVLALLDYNMGMINNTIIKAFGGEAVKWYQTPKYWPFILIFVHTWKIAGYNSVMYLAAITGIDESLYEAASIDGANKFQQTMKITIPAIRPMMIILTILAIGKIFNADFGLFYNVPLNSGTLLPVTNVIDTFVYNALKTTGDIGMASAAGFLQSVLGFILVFTANRIVNKIDSSNALF